MMWESKARGSGFDIPKVVAFADWIINLASGSPAKN